MCKRAAFLLVMLAALVAGRVGRATAVSGDLDPTFGQAGRLRAGFGSNVNYGAAVAVQADGKTVVLSDCDTGDHNEPLLFRFNVDGSFDASFGMKGRVLTALGEGSSSAVDVEIQADGKIVVAAYSNYGFAVARFHADGGLDTTWGVGGKATISGPYSLQPIGMALQADGKVVVAGKQHNPVIGSDLAVARFTTNGAPDTTFDGDGWLTTDIVEDDTGTGVTIQPDGKILVVGSGDDPYGIVIARYLGNGALDPTFSGDGKVFLAGYSGSDIGIQYTAFPLFKIIVAGTSSNGFALFRFDSSGLLDSSFGINGVATANFSINSRAFALTFSHNATTPSVIIAAGYVITGGENRIAVARFLPNGALDTTFGSLGSVSTAINGRARGSAIVLAGDKIVVVGTTGTNPQLDCATVRYNNNGSLDPGFDGDGIRVDDGGARASIARAVATQEDGKLLIAGAAPSAAGDQDFALMRCNHDGSVDASFGTAGRVMTPVSAGNDIIYGVAIQADGKVVVAGESENGGDFEIALARYNANGTLDTGFGTNGIVQPVMGPGFDYARAVAVQADGRIVVAGMIQSGTYNHFAVLRFAADGVLELIVIAKPPGTDGATANALALQPDGRIVVAGMSWNGRTTPLFTALRLQADGSPDLGFDADGWVRTAVGVGIGSANAAVIQPDGRVVLAGVTGATAAENIAVIRYLQDGSLDASFAGDGIAIYGAGTGSDFGRALALQSNGKILIAGVAGGLSADFTAVRLQADGALDVSYGNGGIKIIDFDLETTDTGYAMRIDADGNAVVAGDSKGLVGVVRLLGDPVTSSVSELEPGRMRFGLAWPNPMRQHVSIALHLDAPGRVTAGIFDARGRLVRNLGSVDLPAGNRSLTWDGRDAAGGTTPSGVYWIRARRGGETRASRITVLR